MSWRRYCTLPAVLAIAACSNEVAAPPSPMTGLTRFASIKHSVSTNPNSQKYSNTGAQPATGRSGSASLELRALLNKDGSTDVEVTTGSLEAGTKPGNIDKTQVKLLLGDTPAKNYNNLKGGGYWTVRYPGLQRGNGIQVQANVSGIDPKRTDVVTVRTEIRRRPDIAVTAVSGPSNGAPHTPIMFTATVQELHGDVGARSDCVLSVNGTDVDHAQGIWVDAAGTVSCAFQRTFASSGTYQIGVRAANVNPADWDTANNSASTSITISSDEPIAHGYLSALQYDVNQMGSWSWYYPWYGENGNGSWNWKGKYSNVYSGAWENGPRIDLYSSVEASVENNGAVSHTSSLVPQQSYDYDDGSWYSSCAWYYTMGEWASACSHGSTFDTNYQWRSYWYQYASGTVTYYGQNTYCNWWGCNSWSWNNTNVYSSGASHAWPAGSNVRLQVRFVDASGMGHTIDRSVQLQDRSHYVNYSYPWSCWTDWWSGAQYCNQYSSSGTYFEGSTSW
jgi:hypothetical protein